MAVASLWPPIHCAPPSPLLRPCAAFAGREESRKSKDRSRSLACTLFRLPAFPLAVVRKDMGMEWERERSKGERALARSFPSSLLPSSLPSFLPSSSTARF